MGTVSASDVYKRQVFASELLRYRYPNEFPLYSNPSYKALITLHLAPNSKRDTYGKDYPEYVLVMRDLLNALKQYDPLKDADFCTVETFLYAVNELGPIDEISMTAIQKEETLLVTLLKRKGQVILYGPPGTGKTYSVQSLIKGNRVSSYAIDEKDYGEVQFFWAIIFKDKFDDYSTINTSTIYTYEWKHSYHYFVFFEKIKIGDIFATYLWDEHRISGFAKCVEKGDNSFQYQFLLFCNGPTYTTLKEDPEFRTGRIIRTKANARITTLEQNEFERLLILSGVEIGEIGIPVSTITQKEPFYKFITFHQSFTYEEFIEGLRPKTDPEGKIRYEVQEGVFKSSCRSAYNILASAAGIDSLWDEEGDIPELNDEEMKQFCEKAEEVPYYFIIDEINRGDISRIFGELISLLEKDKRICSVNGQLTDLPYSRTKFGIPPNLFLIGTMNTADKSIALIDIALRRRFGFIEIMPDYQLLRNTFAIHDDPEVKAVLEVAVSLLQVINSRILIENDRDHQIGHSYLMKLVDCLDRDSAIEEFSLIWYHEIIPLLQEYFYDSPKQLYNVIGSNFLEKNPKSLIFKDKLSSEEFLNACMNIKNNKESDEFSPNNAF